MFAKEARTKMALATLRKHFQIFYFTQFLITFTIGKSARIKAELMLALVPKALEFVVFVSYYSFFYNKFEDVPKICNVLSPPFGWPLVLLTNQGYLNTMQIFCTPLSVLPLVTLGCGSSTTENCTYFEVQNSAAMSGQCRTQICKCQSDICQIRYT